MDDVDWVADRPGRRGATGGVEVPGDGERLPRSVLGASGWLLSSDATPVDTAFLLVDGKVMAPLRTGLARPDLAPVFRDIPSGGSCGWEATLDLRAINAGRATLSLLGRSGDGTWFEVPGPSVTLLNSRSDGRRRRAAFTIAQNEPVFLPLWSRHYRQHFEKSDLYVLDHDSSDGAVAAIADECTVVPVHRAQSFDHDWLRSTVGAFQRFLLQSYEAVLFTEVDEFVVADPERYIDLTDYMDLWRGVAARCTGFNVVQKPGEQPLAFDRPVLGQRGYWHRAPRYDKTLLARGPLEWAQGFHRELTATEPAPDPSLLLIHLHRADYGYCLTRHRSAAGRTWSERDRAAGLGAQNLITEASEFDEWFFRGPDIGEIEAQAIPDRLRSIL